jgi:branched-subunit amino acid aminotransferase/4-amino-4-deoxychorismate lyase
VGDILPRAEVDGRPVDVEVVPSMESRTGHFTAMQVRDGRTRGLDLHLSRLKAANRELFDIGFDGEHVRALIRQALQDTKDASVRVYVLEAEAQPAMLVTVREPAKIASPQRLKSVAFQRPQPHLKHLAAGQGPYREHVQREGFDDALLVGDDGAMSETSIANIGFFEGPDVVWPDAPQLQGITMQLLETALPARGIQTRRATVRLRDIPSFEGAFLTNARGVAAVTGIDDVELPASEERTRSLTETYDSVTWDVL